MSKSPTVNFHPFSDDLWDYLEDMVYMPCRADRDALVAAGKEEQHFQHLMLSFILSLDRQKNGVNLVGIHNVPE